jgi:hypothetical protein
VNLDQHIEQNDADYAGGNGRTCYVCKGDYGLAGPEYEDVGVCIDCSQGMVREALRYRWLRVNPVLCANFADDQTYGCKKHRPEEFDKAVDAAMERESSHSQ